MFGTDDWPPALLDDAGSRASSVISAFSCREKGQTSKCGRDIQQSRRPVIPNLIQDPFVSATNWIVTAYAGVSVQLEAARWETQRRCLRLPVEPPLYIKTEVSLADAADVALVGGWGLTQGKNYAPTGTQGRTGLDF